jgi:hypothetical protein
MPADLQVLIHASMAREMALPAAPPLTLTRNFAWVVLFCTATLVVAPLLIGWTASLVLR